MPEKPSLQQDICCSNWKGEFSGTVFLHQVLSLLKYYKLTETKLASQSKSLVACVLAHFAKCLGIFSS